MSWVQVYYKTKGYMITKQKMPPKQIPCFVHNRHHTSFYVQNGSAIVYLDDQAILVSRGDVVAIPQGSLYAVETKSASIEYISSICSSIEDAHSIDQLYDAYTKLHVI